jgi:hypothetical protein
MERAAASNPQEKGPVRQALIEHLRQRMDNQELKGSNVFDASFQGAVGDWCKEQKPSVRVTLWMNNSNPVATRSVKFLSLVDLRHIKKSFEANDLSAPVPESIEHAIAEEENLIWQQTYSPERISIVVPQLPDGNAVEELEQGACCVCWQRLFSFGKKKDLKDL